MNFGFPSNAMEYFTIIVPIVNYDVLENVQTYEEFIVSISSQNDLKKPKRALA